MQIPKEQIQQLKKQVINQINTTFPEDKKQSAISQINSMNDEQFIEFLKQNNLIKTDGSQTQGQCIFCSIVFGDIPSTKIGENEKAIAILEINPLSKGHTLVIQKEHQQEIQKKAEELAREIRELLKDKLSPKDVLMEHKELMGHGAIDVIPVYEDENLNSPRKQAKPGELEKLKKQLEEISKQKKPETEETEKPKEEINEKNTWLPKRIP